MKIHILLTPDPPRFGTTLQAICGATVPSAQPLRHDNEELPRQTTIFCTHCQKKFTQTFRYVAWIISGEESKQMEGGA